MAALSRAQRDEYHERGFLNVAAALPPALLDSLTAALAAEVERRARTLYAGRRDNRPVRRRSLYHPLVPPLAPTRR